MLSEKKGLTSSEDKSALYLRKFGIKIKSEADIAGIKVAGKLAVDTPQPGGGSILSRG